MLLTPFIEGRTKPSIPNKSKYPPCMSHSRMAIIAAKGVCVCVCEICCFSTGHLVRGRSGLALHDFDTGPVRMSLQQCRELAV